MKNMKLKILSVIVVVAVLISCNSTETSEKSVKQIFVTDNPNTIGNCKLTGETLDGLSFMECTSIVSGDTLPYSYFTGSYLTDTVTNELIEHGWFHFYRKDSTLLWKQFFYFFGREATPKSILTTSIVFDEKQDTIYQKSKFVQVNTLDSNQYSLSLRSTHQQSGYKHNLTIYSGQDICYQKWSDKCFFEFSSGDCKLKSDSMLKVAFTCKKMLSDSTYDLEAIIKHWSFK